MRDFSMNAWTIFSNHGHVLVCLARDPESRLRDVAADVGITERAVQKIVRDLQDGGMVSVTKHGRRNRYRINLKQTLRHDLESHCTLSDLIEFIDVQKPEQQAAAEAQPEAGNDEEVTSEPSITEKPAGIEFTKESVTAAKPKKDKREAEKSIEKQQGSLF